MGDKAQESEDVKPLDFQHTQQHQIHQAGSQRVESQSPQVGNQRAESQSPQDGNQRAESQSSPVAPLQIEQQQLDGNLPQYRATNACETCRQRRRKVSTSPPPSDFSNERKCNKVYPTCDRKTKLPLPTDRIIT